MPKTKEQKLIDNLVKALYKGYAMQSDSSLRTSEEEDLRLNELWKEGYEAREKVRKLLKLKAHMGDTYRDGIEEYIAVTKNRDFYYNLVLKLLEREDYTETIPRLLLASSSGQLFAELMDSEFGSDEIKKITSALNEVFLGRLRMSYDLHSHLQFWMTPLNFFDDPFRFGNFDLTDKFKEKSMNLFPTPILLKKGEFDITGIFYSVPRMPITVSEILDNPHMEFCVVDDLTKYSDISGNETRIPGSRKRPFVFDKENGILYMTNRGKKSDMRDFTGNMFVMYKVFEYIARKLEDKLGVTELFEAGKGNNEAYVKKTIEDAIGENAFTKLVEKKVFGDNIYESFGKIISYFAGKSKTPEKEKGMQWKFKNMATGNKTSSKFLSEVLSGLRLKEDTKVIVSFSDSVYTKSVMLSGLLYSNEFLSHYKSTIGKEEDIGHLSIYQRYELFEKIREYYSNNQEKMNEFEELIIKYESKSKIKRVNQSIRQGQSARVIDLRKTNLKFNEVLNSDINDRNTVIIDFDYALGDQILELVRGIKAKTGRVDSLWATTRVAGISDKMQVGDVFLADMAYLTDISKILVERESLRDLLSEEYPLKGPSSGVMHESSVYQHERNFTRMAAPLKNRLLDYHHSIFAYDAKNNVHRGGGIKTVSSVVWQQRGNLLVEEAILELMDLNLSAIDMESGPIGELVGEGTVKETALAYFMSDHPIKGLTLANTEIPNKYMLLAQTSMMPFKTLRKQYN